MDTAHKLDVLQQQIDDANNGDPDTFELWRQRTDVALRTTVGEASALYDSFKKIHYSPMVFSTDTPDSVFDNSKRNGVRGVIALLEAAKMEVELVGGTPEPADPSPGVGRRTIFIVHGRDEARMHEVARFLRQVSGYEPTILHEQANRGRTIIEKFEDHAAEAAYAVVIGTGDDLGRLVGSDADQPRARQNVIFELGFFFGALGRSRVALLHEAGVERPSDTDGLVRIPLDAAGGWKLNLARELQAAGVAVTWDALGSA